MVLPLTFGWPQWPKNWLERKPKQKLATNQNTRFLQSWASLSLAHLFMMRTWREATTELESHWCPFTGTAPNPLLPTMHRHPGVEANEGTSLPASFFPHCSLKIFTGKVEKGAHFIWASVFLLKIRTSGSICLRSLSWRATRGGWPRSLFDILLLCIKFHLTKQVCGKKKLKNIVWKT